MKFSPRLPERSPGGEDLAERDRFQNLVRESLPSVRAAAEAWRNGLAAFVTLLGTAVVVKGRGTAAEMPVEWRAVVTALLGGGLVLVVVGLWQALAAQAGTRPLKVTLAEIHRVHGSVDLFEVAMADRAARRLTYARRAVALSLALLFAGTALTWWAPAAPPASVRVNHRAEVTCGTLLSADGGKVRVAVRGRQRAVEIPLAEVDNMAVVANCT